MAHRHRIRKGDEVAVVSGVDRGKRGRVLRVIREKDKVVVSGVNLVHRHIRRSQKNPQGGRIRREMPIHLSNVMLVPPEESEPTRVGRLRKDPEKGARGWVRVSRKSGNEVSVEGAKKGRKAKE